MSQNTPKDGFAVPMIGSRLAVLIWAFTEMPLDKLANGTLTPADLSTAPSIKTEDLDFLRNVVSGNMNQFQGAQTAYRATLNFGVNSLPQTWSIDCRVTPSQINKIVYI